MISHTLGELHRLRRRARRDPRARGLDPALHLPGLRFPPAVPPTTRAWSANTGSSATRAFPWRSRSRPSSAIGAAVGLKGGVSMFGVAVGRDGRHAGGAARCKARGLSASPAIINVAAAAIARETDGSAADPAGPEIGVASTKAFTAQVAALAGLAIAAGRACGTIDPATGPSELTHRADRGAPGRRRAAAQWAGLSRSSRTGLSGHCVLFLGRGVRRPACARRRLQAQGDVLHPRRGLRRGRAQARPDGADRRAGAGHRGGAARPQPVREDHLQPARDAAARAARSSWSRTPPGAPKPAAPSRRDIPMPKAHPFTNPLLYAVPVQLFGLSHGRIHGHGRRSVTNLAKSVTVE